MKVLIFGDIYGRLGRKAFIKEFESLQEKYNPDFCIANIENITSGRGPITEHAEMIENVGVDIMTSGDHIYDNAPNILEYLRRENSKLIRPVNMYNDPDYPLEGKGYTICEKNGKKLLVIQAMGEVFMNHKVSNPFHSIADVLSNISEIDYDGVVVDFHRETTAELYGMANFLDGKASVVYGTHTHIQTNDARILEGGTGVIADVGMNGPYNSVIGAQYNSVEKRFLTGIARGKIEQQLEGPYVINALYVEIDEKKQCSHIENISFTGTL